MLGEIVSHIKSSWNRILEDMLEFMRMPSVSRTGEGIEETARYLKDYIEDRLGGSVQLLRYGGHPIVYGFSEGTSDRRLIIYNMYDVQPPDPIDLWEVPPFSARIVDGKIIVRGALNTKGPLIAQLKALEIIKRLRGDLPLNLVYVIEGEEELGSPSIPKLIQDREDELREAEGVYFHFAWELEEGKPLIVLGTKGIFTFRLRVRTSDLDVHSSHGHGLINPGVRLMQAVLSMVDERGNVHIDGFYDDVVEPDEKDIRYINDLMEAYSFDMLAKEYGIHTQSYRGREWYLRVFYRPTINLNGFKAGYVGKDAKTIVPAEAEALLDVRLVPNMDVDKTKRLIREHLEKRGFKDISIEFSAGGYRWSKTDPDSSLAKAAASTYRHLNYKPYIVPMLPGSAPMSHFNSIGLPTVSAGLGHGGRVHAPNEYITVDGLQRCLLSAAIFMLQYSSI